MVIIMPVYAVRFSLDKYLFKGEKTLEEFKKDVSTSLEEIIDYINIAQTIKESNTTIMITKNMSKCPDINEKINTVRKTVKELTNNQDERMELSKKLMNVFTRKSYDNKDIDEFLNTIIILSDYLNYECDDNLTIMFYNPNIDLYNIIEMNFIVNKYLREKGFKVYYPAFDSILEYSDLDLYDEQFERFIEKMSEKGWEYINIEDTLTFNDDNYVLENGKWRVKGV